MGRSRFVELKTVRIYLVDSARHQLAKLQAVPRATDQKASEAQAAAIVDAELNIAAAEQDGDYIDVKSELSAGEARRVYSDLVKVAKHGQAWELDPEQVGITRMLQYLKGWSFTQRLADGSEMAAPITEGAIRQLDQDTFREIDQALDWHEENVEAARTARKNARGTETTSPGISRLPSVPAGESIG